MPQEIPWRKTLGARVGGAALLLLVVSLLLFVGNFFVLSSVRGDAASMDLFGQGRTYCYEMLYHANRLFYSEDMDERTRAAKALRDTMDRMDERVETLLQGDGDRI